MPRPNGDTAVPDTAVPDDTVTIAFTNSEPLASNPDVTVNGETAIFVNSSKAPVDFEYIYSTRKPGSGDVESVLAWEKLEVQHARTDGDRGVVEFTATYRVGKTQHQMRERSQFVLEDGQWYYTRGEVR